MEIGKASIVIDAQAGSGGKGKVAAFLAGEFRPRIAVANFGPNAGHTVVNGGSKFVLRHFPAALFCRDTVLVIGAGAAIHLPTLHAEAAPLEAAGYDVMRRLHIHPRAAIVNQSDIALEQAELGNSGSTCKGVGSASANKLMRRPGSVAADVPELREYVERYTRRLDPLARAVMGSSGGTLLETSQGFDICLNHGVSYPYCTSRQVSAAQALADAGLPPRAVGQVYGVVRPYPIKVGDITNNHGDGVPASSGPYAADSNEITWETVAISAGMDDAAFQRLVRQEVTTVTGRLRRVFMFSWDRFDRFCTTVGPTALILNFADQLDASIYGATDVEAISDLVMRFVARLESVAGVPVIAIGTGPDTGHMIKLMD